MRLVSLERDAVRGGPPEYWLQSRWLLPVPAAVKEERRLGVRHGEVEISLPLGLSAGQLDDLAANSRVFVCLPTAERLCLPLLLNSDFLLTSSRESIQWPLPWNSWLVGEVGRLCAAAVQQAMQHVTAAPRPAGVAANEALCEASVLSVVACICRWMETLRPQAANPLDRVRTDVLQQLRRTAWVPLAPRTIEHAEIVHGSHLVCPAQCMLAQPWELQLLLNAYSLTSSQVDGKVWGAVRDAVPLVLPWMASEAACALLRASAALLGTSLWSAKHWRAVLCCAGWLSRHSVKWFAMLFGVFAANWASLASTDQLELLKNVFGRLPLVPCEASGNLVAGDAAFAGGSGASRDGPLSLVQTTVVTLQDDEHTVRRDYLLRRLGFVPNFMHDQLWQRIMADEATRRWSQQVKLWQEFDYTAYIVGVAGGQELWADGHSGAAAFYRAVRLQLLVLAHAASESKSVSSLSCSTGKRVRSSTWPWLNMGERVVPADAFKPGSGQHLLLPVDLHAAWGDMFGGQVPAPLQASVLHDAYFTELDGGAEPELWAELCRMQALTGSREERKALLLNVVLHDAHHDGMPPPFWNWDASLFARCHFEPVPDVLTAEQCAAVARALLWLWHWDTHKLRTCSSQHPLSICSGELLLPAVTSSAPELVCTHCHRDVTVAGPGVARDRLHMLPARGGGGRLSQVHWWPCTALVAEPSHAELACALPRLPEAVYNALCPLVEGHRASPRTADVLRSTVVLLDDSQTQADSSDGAKERVLALLAWWQGVVKRHKVVAASPAAAAAPLAAVAPLVPHLPAFHSMLRVLLRMFLGMSQHHGSSAFFELKAAFEGSSLFPLFGASGDEVLAVGADFVLTTADGDTGKRMLDGARRWLGSNMPLQLWTPADVGGEVGVEFLHKVLGVRKDSLSIEQLLLLLGACRERGGGMSQLWQAEVVRDIYLLLGRVAVDDTRKRQVKLKVTSVPVFRVPTNPDDEGSGFDWVDVRNAYWISAPPTGRVASDDAARADKRVALMDVFAGIVRSPGDLVAAYGQRHGQAGVTHSGPLYHTDMQAFFVGVLGVRSEPVARDWLQAMLLAVQLQPTPCRCCTLAACGSDAHQPSPNRLCALVKFVTEAYGHLLFDPASRASALPQVERAEMPVWSIDDCLVSRDKPALMLPRDLELAWEEASPDACVVRPFHLAARQLRLPALEVASSAVRPVRFAAGAQLPRDWSNALSALASVRELVPTSVKLHVELAGGAETAAAACDAEAPPASAIHLVRCGLPGGRAPVAPAQVLAWLRAVAEVELQSSETAVQPVQLAAIEHAVVVLASKLEHRVMYGAGELSAARAAAGGEGRVHDSAPWHPIPAKVVRSYQANPSVGAAGVEIVPAAGVPMPSTSLCIFVHAAHWQTAPAEQTRLRLLSELARAIVDLTSLNAEAKLKLCSRLGKAADLALEMYDGGMREADPAVPIIVKALQDFVVAAEDESRVAAEIANRESVPAPTPTSWTIRFEAEYARVLRVSSGGRGSRSGHGGGPQGDFSERDWAVGNWGEQYIYRDVLPTEGYTPANGYQVTWLNEGGESRMDHDIQIWRGGKIVYHVEVKATVMDCTRFFMSAGEWALALRERERYRLYIVTRALTDAPGKHVVMDLIAAVSAGTVKLGGRAEWHGP